MRCACWPCPAHGSSDRRCRRQSAARPVHRERDLVVRGRTPRRPCASTTPPSTIDTSSPSGGDALPVGPQNDLAGAPGRLALLRQHLRWPPLYPRASAGPRRVLHLPSTCEFSCTSCEPRLCAVQEQFHTIQVRVAHTSISWPSCPASSSAATGAAPARRPTTPCSSRSCPWESRRCPECRSAS